MGEMIIKEERITAKEYVDFEKAVGVLFGFCCLYFSLADENSIYRTHECDDGERSGSV